MIDGWTRAANAISDTFSRVGSNRCRGDCAGRARLPHRTAVCAPTEWSGRPEISAFLRYELEDHFGLDPERRDVGAIADRLVAWWATTATDDAPYQQNLPGPFRSAWPAPRCRTGRSGGYEARRPIR